MITPTRLSRIGMDRRVKEEEEEEEEGEEEGKEEGVERFEERSFPTFSRSDSNFIRASKVVDSRFSRRNLTDP